MKQILQNMHIGITEGVTAPSPRAGAGQVLIPPLLPGSGLFMLTKVVKYIWKQPVATD